MDMQDHFPIHPFPCSADRCLAVGKRVVSLIIAHALKALKVAAAEERRCSGVAVARFCMAMEESKSINY